MARPRAIAPIVIAYHLLLTLVIICGILSVSTPWTNVTDAGAGQDSKITLSEWIGRSNADNRPRARFMFGALISGIGVTTGILIIELTALLRLYTKIENGARLYAALIGLSINLVIFCSVISIYAVHFNENDPGRYYAGAGFAIVGIATSTLALIAAIFAFADFGFVSGGASPQPQAQMQPNQLPPQQMQGQAAPPQTQVSIQGVPQQGQGVPQPADV